MNRSRFLLLSLLLASTAAFGQTSSTDSQTLQALLAEARQLRQELRTTTVAAQRVQILLYRLQIQEGAVARASQRLDDARARLAEMQSNWAKLSSDIKWEEDFVSHTENPPADRKQVEDLLCQNKAKLASLENEQQQKQTREMEAEEQLRLAQAKLGELQDQLDRLDKSLETSNR